MSNDNIKTSSSNELTHAVSSVSTISSEQKYSVNCYTSDRERYRTEFKTWSKKTAQAILKMSRIVYDAEQNLSKKDFKNFVEEIDYANSPATIRKFQKIGEKYEAFYKYAELLPNSWTTIYEITLLPADVFEKLVESQNSLIHITGEQIKQLKSNQTAVESDSQCVPASVSTSDTVVAATASPEAIPSASINAEAARLSDQKFAKQATDSMLERVTSSVSSTPVVNAVEVPASCNITLLFKEPPSEIQIQSLIASIELTKKLMNIDFDIVPQSICNV